MAYATLIGPVTAFVPDVLKQPVRGAYGRVLSAFSSRWHAGYDGDRSILILGSPRSGTTWLMNLVCTLPGTCPVFEPLNRRHDRRVTSILGEARLRLAPDDEAPQLEHFLGRVLSGAHFTRWSSAYASVPRILGAERFVVKFVRAMGASGWLARHFPRNKKIVILRHPCAVVASMINSPNFPSGPGRAEEEFAVGWCADTLAAVTETPPADVLLLTHEGLVSDPVESLARLFDYLETPVPPAVLSEVTRPSATANGDAAIVTGDDVLTAWQRRLKDAQIGRILHVVRDAGIDFYDGSTLPDVTRLAAAHATGRAIAA